MDVNSLTGQCVAFIQVSFLLLVTCPSVDCIQLLTTDMMGYELTFDESAPTRAKVNSLWQPKMNTRNAYAAELHNPPSVIDVAVQLRRQAKCE